MNLGEERNYQKLLDTLDILELSTENRKLAESYMDLSKPGDTELLKGAEHQDFSGLDKEKHRKSIEYTEHLRKRNRMDELERYVRFVVAVGGSTASYLLMNYGWHLNTILSYLSREQAAAIRAEGIVWNQYALRSQGMEELLAAGRKNPEILRDAMKLCYHKYDNAKVLLAAIYLHFCEPEKEKGETLKFLENNLINSMPELFPNPKPTNQEIQILSSFMYNASGDAPLTNEVLSLINGKKFNSYLLTLLTGAAFLAIEHSIFFKNFVRVAVAMDLEVALNSCKDIGTGTTGWFLDHIKRLEDGLSVSPEKYIRWCMKNQQSGALNRMAARHPECYSQIIKDPATTTEEYQYLLVQAKGGNPELFQTLQTSLAGEFEGKVVNELLSRKTTGVAEARHYLLGEGTLESLYPFVNSWRGGYDYGYNRAQKLEYLEKHNHSMYVKGVIVEALSMHAYYFTSYYFSKMGKDIDLYRKEHHGEVEKLVKLFECEKLPIRYQADAMEAIYDGFYAEERKAIFMDGAVEALARRYADHAEELREAAKESTAIARGIIIRVLDRFWQQEKEMLFACAMDSSKQVREVLQAVFASHKEWEPDMKAMLTSKKSQEREMAVLTLKQWGAEKYQAELTAALEKEKSKKIKELIQNCLGVETTISVEEKAQGPQELAASLLKGGKARKVAWAYETPFSEVHKKDGSLVGEDYLQAILVAYADKSAMGISPEAAILADTLNPQELAHYVMELFDKWMEAGAEAKKKWVLYAASIHGGDEIVPLFWRHIQDWPQRARGAMAAEAVKALALNGGSQALLLVDQISRKFKFKQVKAAAAQALEAAASALGISRAELEDRIVPNLGFDENMKRIFDYGTRSFQVYLTPALELEIFDEQEKRLKNLPAPGKKDDEEKAAWAYAEFKQFKKQLKTVTTTQKLRLEQALTTERLWTTDKWKELFVNNPVMHQFAIGLIWGVYEDGTLKETFRYMEDGSFNTMEEEEMELPEGGTISLVHPIELSQEALATWKEQLSDYEITQPIEQLERSVYRVTEEEIGADELTRFGGKLLNGLSLSGKLQGMGWYRGSVQDAGGYDTFYREDGEIGVELEFSGLYVGGENEEITVYGASFYKAGTVRRGSYVYDTIKKENRYGLDEVNPRYFSEIVLQLHRATASSQEQLPYPDCKRN